MKLQRLDITFTPHLIKEIDSVVKKGTYGSRSEFLRAATRKQLEEIRTQQLIEEVRAQKGIFTGKFKPTTDKEKDEIMKKIAEEHGFKL